MDEQSIFAEALERDPAARPAYLDAACGDNPSLRRRLDMLLREYEHAGSFLERPVAARPDSADAPEALAPAGGVLGDFRILREIGRGGMGVVYEAEQISLRRRVALKVLPFAAVLDKRQLQRFKTEAMAAGRLHHPHIVPVYQVGCERAVHFYAMQYIEGRNISELLEAIRRASSQADGLPSDATPEASAWDSPRADFVDQSRARQEAADGRPIVDPDATRLVGRVAGAEPQGSPGDEDAGVSQSSNPGHPVAPTAALRDTALLHNFSTDYSTNKRNYHRTIAELGIQAAEALDFAHEHGILHRDVKPSNLMLDEAGNLWITDFGLARIEGDSGLTMSGDLLGTLRYMSPEQVLGKRVIIDERTDVYSLGVTLYEMLTLRPAYEGADRAELLRKISFEEPVPPRKLDPTIPADLETILLTATAHDPRGRYETAQALADDLQRFLDHKPILAKRPSRVERGRKWVRRNKPLAAALALLLVAAITTTSLLVSVLTKRDTPAAAAIPSQPASELVAEPAPPRAPHKGQYLPGLVPEPPLIPGVGRWQMITAKPRGVMESAVWSPDETMIALGEAGNVRIYEAESLRLLHVLVGHTRHVSSVCWHPDGTRLASSSWDGTVRLWTADGIPTHQLTGHEGEVYQVAWRPDGQQLASCGADHTVRLWNEDGTSHSVLRDHQNHVFCLAYSPDGRTLATGGGDIRPPDENGNPGDNAIRLWDVATETVKARLEGHRMSVQCVAWHPDGERLASGDGDVYRTTQFRNFVQPAMRVPTVRVWSEDGKAGPTLTGEFGSVWALVWQPDSDTLAFGGRLGEIKLWHPYESAIAETLIPYVSESFDFNSIVWDRAGRRVLSTQRFSAAIWNVDGNLIVNLDGIPGKGLFEFIGWSPDGQQVSNAQQVWRADGTPEPRVELPKMPSPDEERWLRNIAFSFEWNPQNESYAHATRDSVRLANESGGRSSLPMGGMDPRPWISDLRWSPDGRRLAAPSWNDARVRVWDEQGELITILKGHRGGVQSVDWSPDSQWLASGGGDSVRLWTRDGTPGPVMTGHTDEVHPVAWSPDGQWIASGATDCTVRLWRPDGTPGPVLWGHQAGVFSVAWSPDSKRLASGGWLDGTLRVWNVETGKTEWIAARISADLIVTFTPKGLVSHGDSEDARQRLLYLVERPSGAMDILTSDEFMKRHAAELARQLVGEKDAMNAALAFDSFLRVQNTNSSNQPELTGDFFASAAVGDFFLAHGFFGEAAIAFTGLLKQRPEYHIFKRRGAAYMGLKEYDKALADITIAVEMNPEDASNFTWFPQNFLWESPPEVQARFLDLATKAIELCPTNAALFTYRAQLHAHLGDQEKAVVDVKQALEIKPQDATSANNVAWFFATSPVSSLRDTSRAVELAQQAVELAPQEANHWNTLGAAQYRVGDFQAAIASLQKSHELAPGAHDSFDFFFLAMAHWHLGDRDQARDYYTRAVEWMERNKPQDDDLLRFRAEAEELLEIASRPTTVADPAETNEQP